MAAYNLIKMQNKLRKYMDETRFYHTMGVMYTAASLAMCHGADLERAQVAGLLHDCAKCIPNDKKLKLCKLYKIPVSEVERKSPQLLHARLGSFIAETKYDIKDPEILSAINCHTTGKPEMTLLEKIIFVADYIEPMRNKAFNLEQIRSLAFQDLDLAVYVILHDTIEYLKDSKSCLDNSSVLAYNYYKNIIEEREA